MSNPLAIAAVTATLRNLLIGGLGEELAGGTVTTKPLDKARNGTAPQTGNQVNLFLYRTEMNAAWRNMDMPRQVRPGETGHPPLPLNLYYLVTAYGGNDDDTVGHRLLGRAMSILHDHPLLGAAEIEAALNGNDLHKQVERIRITPQPLSVDEMSKLWTAFQTQYRVSAAYHVSVILIESTRPARTPLPVLTRGPADEGVRAQPDLIPPFPTLESVEPPNRQPSVRLGEVLTLRGHHLDGDDVAVLFTSPRLEEAIEVDAMPERTATELRVTIPDAPEEWVAGFYTVAAVISRAEEADRTTNALPLAVAPVKQAIDPEEPERDAEGNVTLAVLCSPEVRPGQRAALLLGDREILAEARTEQTETLTFVIEDAPVGDHWVRLRVDGVDSLLVDRTQTPPVFDETQRVTIT